MPQVWGIAKRTFKEGFKRRMMMFDSLVFGVTMYGIEFLGLKESSEIERIQLKYHKWSLGLDWCTPGYMVLAETNREREERNERKIRKSEKGLRTSTHRLILKECLKEKERKERKEKEGKKRKEVKKGKGRQKRKEPREREGKEV